MILTNTTLTMKRHLKTCSIPLSELEGFYVGATPKQSSRIFSDIVSGGISAVSDTQFFEVAKHMSKEEIEYLHNVILRRMVGIEESE